MKPPSSIANRLLALQTSLEQDVESARSRDMAVVMQALALLAEGVGKTSRDVRELSQAVRNKGPAAGRRTKAPPRSIAAE